jgi:hypothetical protein
MTTGSHGRTWATIFTLGSLTACGGTDPAGSGGAAEAGAGPSGPVTTATAGNAGGTTTVAQTSQASTGVGGSSYVCDPPAEPGSLYELTAVSYDIAVMEPVSMCEFRDQVLLIVNTAAA